MLDKIKRFEDAFDVQSLPETKPATPLVSRDFRAYDAEGWLTAVKSSTKPVAPYALVDADGKRICFVSPAPGLGVSSHVDKRVGLYGKRGLIPELNEPHVLASKVVDLDKAREGKSFAWRKKIAGWVGGAIPISSRRKNIPQLLATTAGGQCLHPARHPVRNEVSYRL